MSGADTPVRPAPTSFDALLAATDLRHGGDGRAAVAAMLRAAAASVGAEAAVLHRVDPRTGLLRPAGCQGVLPGGPAVVEAVAAEALEGAEAVLRPGGGGPAVLALPVRAGERVLGAVSLVGDRPQGDDPARRHAAAVAVARIGWELDRQEVGEALERAMADLLEHDERMLGRIGLDIHDGPSQQLSVALLEVQLLEVELGDAETGGAVLPERLRPGLLRIYETLGGALNEMRELIGNLRPAQLEGRGVPDLLGDVIEAFRLRSDAEATLAVTGDPDEKGISLSQRITLYRILQEALSNADRHGRARHVAVRLAYRADGVAMEVEDDGAGFDVGATLARSRAAPRARFGLVGMRERAVMLGGTLAITSAPGQGTLVSVFLPRWRPGDPALHG